MLGKLTSGIFITPPFLFILLFRFNIITQKHARSTLHCILRMKLFKTIVWPLLITVYRKVSEKQQFVLTDILSELAFDLLCAASAADNQTTVIGEGSHLDLTHC